MVLSGNTAGASCRYIAAKTEQMKKTALRYGLYGILTILAVFFMSWLLLSSRTDNYQTREVVGWTGIFLSVVFVFFGLKYYRDKQNGGSLSFMEGLKLGLLIVLFPSVAFGLFNVFYILVLDPDFLDKYYGYQVEQLKNSVPAAELDRRIKEVQDTREMFSSPFIQFIVMFLSVAAIGLIVTVISTLILKRRMNH
jgi:putative flippase GtrA